MIKLFSKYDDIFLNKIKKKYLPFLKLFDELPNVNIHFEFSKKINEGNIESIESLFNREDFFNSRVVFYPGAYVDGHAIKLFGSSHAAHCFVYCDYWHEQNEISRLVKNSESPAFQGL